MTLTRNRTHFRGSRAWHDYGIFIGYPRTALTFLNRPRVVALFSGLTQMWASPRKTEEGRPQIRNGSVDGGNPLISRMPATAPPARSTGIYRYPVKGLPPEPLARAELSPGQTLLADRRYAIENGPSGFDPAEPKWLPKLHFLMLMRDEWLVGLRTHFDDSSNVLSINHNGGSCQGNLQRRGPAAIETSSPRLFDLIKGPPKVLESPGHSFRTSPSRSSRSSISQRPRHRGHGGAPVHPFVPAQSLCRGLAAWHEFDLVDHTRRSRCSTEGR